MVARKFLVRFHDSDFDVDYDTDDGLEVFKFQVFSLTSIPPEEQKIFGSDDDQLVSDDSDLASISDRLRLVSVTDEVKQEENSVDQNVELAMSDEELARMLQAEEEALVFQQFAAREDRSQMEARIRPYVDQVLMYEDPNRQDAARKTVPVEKLEEKALVALAKEGNFKPTKSEEDYAFLLQLLFWFKQSFRWVNAPSCDGCGSETVGSGMGTALSSETLYGASRVELYRCTICSRTTRFPRYNDPLKLLETRRGRCGEWANCFTLYCRAFGYESRLVLDFTDHVWTECFSPSLGRWMHLDPCEGIYDNPLLYEKGWKKKLDYAIAIAKDGVYDVTKRYTRKWHEVLSRRTITPEPILSTILSNIRRELRQNLTSQVIATLEERDRNEAAAIERDLHSKDEASISLPGRQSGAKEWRISRSEFGSDEICSPSSSSCPVRKCVDEHVTKIYNAFFPVISHFVEKSCSKSRAVEVLQIFRRILVDLKNSPFRRRKTSINSVSNGAQYVFHQMLPSFSQLFDALSLKCESNANGKVDIYLADDPVKTSIALPVLFHALDDVMHNVNVLYNINKDSLSWPLLKLNRICSGLALASGEEFPFGIITSAFDGTRLSKWEEPNGARGCWIIYKVLDNKMHELVAYELMSANDVPERDPKDWVLEGSDDGGSSWRVLDKQNSQMFKNRFERRAYKIASVGFLANAFRFRFLAVRDARENNRLQLGSIDLYARS
ncbi:peptide-N(4)-(N-acetyl-beta-glucosaminyl)asparagine amidase [Rhododendron vialii]|uniref:peptide-N(4)-(N-acetyl-beta- glucosaminyl)asparagine amidase n=1 Tax=Rhododendron vialii TaxID=182163 RepID=UPI00266005E1|nr:peptide-N(4)-(N-acetyl-beta-glucosaminyl)asparagine amidase [Rhododendron vialii]